LSDTPALQASGLFKAFRVGFLARTLRPVLRGLNLEVRQNEVFGYLGPNGSGKTTTLKVLMGLVRADAGSISILGSPLASGAWRHRVGFLPEHPYFYDYLTAREYLDFAGRLFGMPAGQRRDRIQQLIETVGLRRSLEVPLRKFSKGMIQRLGIAQALINDPEMVFLDEPMSGLDPIGRYMVRNIILDLKSRGKTVFFSTHILSDAETLCDRVALLRDGELLRAGRLDEILGLEVSHMEVMVSGVDAAALERLPPGVRAHRAVGERWRLDVAEDALGLVVQAVERVRGRVLSVEAVRQSLEEYFFREMAGSGGNTWEKEA
jgi:ABC-2 type transport system ATP-binding protein